MKVNDVFGRDIEYLYYSAKELGGTILQIACDSGLFEAVDYIQLKIDPNIPGNVLSKEDIEFVEDDGSYTLWTEGCYFLGNGANVGFLCHNYYGNELVKPDIFAVELAMNTYYAECLIRKTEDPYFRIEKISYDDAEVMDHISELIAKALPSNWIAAFLHGEMPTSYKILAYQIAYIRYHYPQLYNEVWSGCPPYLKSDNPDRKDGKDTIGVAVSDKYCYAAYANAISGVGNVYNRAANGKSILEKTKFDGTDDLFNAGLACSKLGLTLKSICESHEYQRNIDTDQINACLMEPVPNIHFVRQSHDSLSNRKEMMAYEALELGNKEYRDIICLSAELAGLKNFRFIENPVIPIMKYYDRNPETRLEEGETAFVLYMDEALVMVGVAEKSNGKFYGRYTVSKTYMPSFDQYLVEKMYELVRPKIELLQVSVSEEDKMEFAKQVQTVKKQLRRSDKATVVFDNGWLSLSETLPIEQAEECFHRLLKKCDLLMQDLIMDEDDDEVMDYLMSDIKKLYLAGPMTDYKILLDLIKREEPFGGRKEVFLSGEPENVVTTGLALL